MSHKKGKVIVRFVSVFLIAATIITFCLSGSAQSDPVYYSDLFFGYSSDYLKSMYLYNHYQDNYWTMNQAFNDFLDSGDAFWMELKTALSAATDLGEMAMLISDAFTDSDFSYWEALDSANEEFVKEMLSEDAKSDNSTLNVGKKITKRSKKIVKVLKEWTDLHGKNLDSDSFSEWKDFFKKNGSDAIYEFLPDNIINTAFDYNNIKGIYDSLNYAYTFFDVATAITLALAIEDVRMEIIDAIIENSGGSGYLYDGMTRLKQQLYGGWITYFLSNYGVDRVVSKLSSVGTKAMEGTLPYLAVCSAILDVASWVVFDVIFDIPDMNDVLTQQALMFYTRDMYQCMKTKASVFNEQFDSNDIEEYEDLFDAYMAAVSAGLSKSEDLLISSNQGIINNVKNQYEDFSYDSYIDDIKDYISDLSENEIKYRPTTDWTITLPAKFCLASDEVERGCYYLFKDAFVGNITFSGSGYIETDINRCNIIGSVFANDLTIKGSNFLFNGNLQVENNLIFNNGQLEVTGNFTLGINCDSYGQLVMQHDDDYLLVDGNFNIVHGLYTDVENSLTAGTLEVKKDFIERGFYTNRTYYYETGTHRTILSGTETQNVSIKHYNNNRFENLIIKNPNINFSYPIPDWTLREDTILGNESNLSVYGTLDLNGFSLTAPGDSSVSYLKTNNGTMSVGNIVIKSATVTRGQNIVNGNLQVENNLLFNNGQLEVTGNFTLGIDCDSYGQLVMQHDDDYLLVDGNFNIVHGSYTDVENSLTAGTLEVKKDFIERGFYTNRTYYYETGTHRTILSGTETQNVSIKHYNNNRFENLIIKNPNINFSYPIPNWTLREDTILINESNLSVYGTLDLNGYNLIVAGSVSYNTLISNGGYIIPYYCYIRIIVISILQRLKAFLQHVPKAELKIIGFARTVTKSMPMHIAKQF